MYRERAGEPDRDLDFDFGVPDLDLDFDLSFTGVLDLDLDWAGEPERERPFAAGDFEADFVEPAGDPDLPLDAEPDLDLLIDRHWY